MSSNAFIYRVEFFIKRGRTTRTAFSCDVEASSLYAAERAAWIALKEQSKLCGMQFPAIAKTVVANLTRGATVNDVLLAAG